VPRRAQQHLHMMHRTIRDPLIFRFFFAFIYLYG
jgi:hypothetical protein